VTATDERNHVVLGAVCYASTGNARALGIFIQQLQLKLPSWTPIFMIDKDKAERAAVLAAGCSFLLCQFHVVQQWEAELRSYFGKDDKKRTEAYAHLITIQRSKTEDELTQNGLAFKDWCLSNGDQAQKFYSYFLGNWLCEEWVTGWVDIYRPSRWGNYGTNNHTESLFKSTRYKEFLRAVTPVRLLATLTDSIFPQREWEERLREVHNG
jgi:hypothetical protein